MLILFFTCELFIAVFNPVSAVLIEGSWNTKTPMSQDRIDLGIVAVGSKIYAIGGTGIYTGLTGANECYDSVTDRWVTLSSMPTPRLGFAIVAYQGKIYCIGGSNSNGLQSVNEVYDIATDSWSSKMPLPVSEYFIQAHVVDGKIWVVTQQTLYVYDPINDSWINKTSTPTQGLHAFSVVLDNKIIIIDQVAHDSYMQYSWLVFIATMKVMIYDPKIDVWSEGQVSPEYHSSDTDMVRPIVAGATTGDYAPKKIYVIFGGPSDYVYNPAENAWSTITGPSTSVLGYSVAVVDDLLYVFGGLHPHVETLQYVPIGHKNAVPAPEPSTTTKPSSNPTATSPATPTPSNPPVKHTLTYIIIAILATTNGIIAIGYFRLRKNAKNIIGKRYVQYQMYTCTTTCCDLKIFCNFK